ncbi:MAG: hypothetical protein H8D45_21930 [Bacteroidetes bacterium]|nr:hypothetical protein [Bacteroidota bacterium]MBL7103816.1 hypothetical protein [Bacteroidales bacterium]
MGKCRNKEEIIIEQCNHCGRKVHFGSGLFVNRVWDFNDIITRIDNGLKFPLGDFVCWECDEKNSDSEY